jgi:hypothetical protein
MRHWTEDLDDDADEPLVRPYTITGGRTTAGRDDLTLITLITAQTTPGTDPAAGRHGLQPEHRTVLRLCARGPVAVAEIAAELDLPVSVTKILIGDPSRHDDARGGERWAPWALIRQRRPRP